MSRLGYVLALAVLIAASSAGAKSLPSDQRDGGLGAFSTWLNDIELAARINTDPVLRAIVCRVPFMNFTAAALTKATRLSRTRIMHAVGDLMDMGLVKQVTGENGRTIIVPTSDEARQKLRRWVYDWCANDDTCGVER